MKQVGSLSALEKKEKKAACCSVAERISCTNTVNLQPFGLSPAVCTKRDKLHSVT